MQKITEENYQEIFKSEEIIGYHFTWINFTGRSFSRKNFIDCIFDKCNLSNVDIDYTTFNDVEFKNSKLVGMNFTQLRMKLSNFNFHDCNLVMCYFNELSLKWISFEDCELFECNFTKTYLAKANFMYANLEKTIFAGTNLESANFEWASNFTINPKINNLEKTIFSRDNVFWLLSYLDIIIK